MKRRMWTALATALFVASCGSSEGGRSVEQWVRDEVPDVDEDLAACVAAELEANESPERLAEWTDLEVSTWSEQDYLERPEVSGALADAQFACTTSDLG